MQGLDPGEERPCLSNIHQFPYRAISLAFLSYFVNLELDLRKIQVDKKFDKKLARRTIVVIELAVRDQFFQN